MFLETSAQFLQNKTYFRLRVDAIRHPRRLAAVWAISMRATITKEDNIQRHVSGTEDIS